MRKILINPFFMFGMTFLSVLCFYQLGLSGLYSKDNGSVTAFLIVIFSIISISMGLIFHPLSSFFLKSRVSNFKVNYKKNLSGYILLIGFALECINNGGIPLLMVLRGNLYDYTQFGIKTFHVFYMGYLSAAAVINIERYVYTKDKKYLKIPLLSILITILILNRGATFLIVFPMGLMFIALMRSKIKIRHMFLTFLAVIGCIVMFGVLGDKRMSSSGYDDSNAIFSIGEANPVFENLPSGFFWTYLYATSPMANLIHQESVDNLSMGAVDDFLAAAIYPDFVSKYTDADLAEKYDLKKITPELNVGTGFSMAFIIMGFIGGWLLFIWFILITAIFLYANRYTYFASACATLTSMAIFMSFNNMLIFSSCVLQLIFVTLFTRFRFKNTLII
ncbi:hypothetical protein [Sphingobacterium sp.]|uniref:hypothetical protein n=1 Tax=Sphingobacterium sp. TaxID=341027 RepID=UPI00289F0B87|nr:hypothetical protein [Sphingobacterium sp.]